MKEAPFIDTHEPSPEVGVILHHSMNPFTRAWGANLRALEFGLGGVILFPNLWIALPFYDSMSSEVYGRYLAIMPEVYWGVLYAAAGLLIWLGLWINGMWGGSPKLRIFGMASSFGVHTSLSTVWYIYSGPDGMSWVVYASLAAAGLYCLLNLSAHLKAQE